MPLEHLTSSRIQGARAAGRDPIRLAAAQASTSPTRPRHPGPRLPARARLGRPAGPLGDGGSTSTPNPRRRGVDHRFHVFHCTRPPIYLNAD
jgi:hypothetical protein